LQTDFDNQSGGIMIGKIGKGLQQVDFHVNKTLAVAVGVLIFFCMLLISFNIGGRYLFGVIIPSTVEMSELIFVLMVFLSITYIEIQGGHLRIKFLYSRLSNKGQNICDILAKLISVVLFGLMTWQTLLYALRAWNTNEASWGLLPIPLWIPKFGVVIGCTLFFLHSTGSLVFHAKKLFWGVE